MRKIQADGFETGLHAWNRVAWEEQIATAKLAWIDAEIGRASKRFAEISGQARGVCR